MRLFEVEFKGLVVVMAKDREEAERQFECWCPRNLMVSENEYVLYTELTRDSLLSYDTWSVQRLQTVEEILWGDEKQ